MNEYLQGLQGTVGLLIALIFSCFWWLGGRPNGRVWRRWIAPLWFSGAMIVFSLWTGKFSWWFFLSIPAYKIMTHIGYGADFVGWKIVRRMIWAVLMVSCSLTFCLFTGAWIVFACQMVMGMFIAVVFGVINPVLAAQEEGIISFSTVYLVPFMVT